MLSSWNTRTTGHKKIIHFITQDVYFTYRTSGGRPDRTSGKRMTRPSKEVNLTLNTSWHKGKGVNTYTSAIHIHNWTAFHTSMCFSLFTFHSTWYVCVSASSNQNEALTLFPQTVWTQELGHHSVTLGPRWSHVHVTSCQLTIGHVYTFLWAV